MGNFGPDYSSGANAASELPLTSNTQLYYAMTESASPCANTGAFGSADMVWSGGQARRATEQGYALRYGGTTHELLQASGTAGFEPASPSIGLWARCKSFGSGCILVCKSWQTGSLTTPFFSIGIQLTDSALNGRFSIFGADTSGSTFIRVDAPVADRMESGRWHYLGVAYDSGAKVLHGFIDGNDVVQANFTGGLAYASSSKGYWKIGGLGTDSFLGIDGHIRSVRVEDVYRDATWYREQYLRGMRRWTGT